MPSKAQAAAYVGGDDPTTLEKQRAYEQAVERLSKSLETRQQRLFDPAMLGAAMELLNPGKTGSFYEAAGRAAGAYGRGQEAMNKEEQDIAQQQVQAAQMGLEIERQRQQDQVVADLLSKGAPATVPAGGLPSGPAPVAGPLAGPTAGALTGPTTGPSAKPFVPTGDTAGAGAGMAPSAGLPAGPSTGPTLPSGPTTSSGAGAPTNVPAGIPIARPMSTQLSGQDYLRMMRGTAPLPELLKEAAKMDLENVKITEGGRYDISQGLYYPVPKGELVERIIYTPEGAKKMQVSPIDAMALDQAVLNKDQSAYQSVVQRVLYGPFAGKSAPFGATGEPLPSVAEAQSRAEAQKELEVGRVKSAVEVEKTLPAKAEAAQRAFAAAADTERIVTKNPAAFGRLKQAGVMPGILNLVSQGLQTPTGSINIKGLDDFVVQATGKEGDLVDRQMAARNMAELVLAFRRQYFSGYGGGAISDMEQSIVNQLVASPQDDPRTILGISNLIKRRAQYDIDENRNWTKFKRENKKASYSDFTESDDYLSRQDKFNQSIAKMVGIEPAVPSQQKSPITPVVGGKPTADQIQAARERLRRIP